MAAGVEVVLLAVLLKRMEPVRLAGRFLVVPLLTIVEGFVLLRPGLTLRMGVGAALLAGGAGMMLLLRGPQEDVSLSLR
jgi:drug/metabolite transporter (DMT)-like permease